jgi:hypothetical protein
VLPEQEKHGKREQDDQQEQLEGGKRHGDCPTMVWFAESKTG